LTVYVSLLIVTGLEIAVATRVSDQPKYPEAFRAINRDTVRGRRSR